jgi:hypothetical protein
MKFKWRYLIIGLLACALLTYLAAVVNCYFISTDCPAPPISPLEETATHITNLNATTQAHFLETQAAITPTSFEPYPTLTLTAPTP